MSTEEDVALLRRAWDEVYGQGRVDSIEEFVLDDVVAEGNKVVSRYTVRGTHKGVTEQYGPPTGRELLIQGITLYRFKDNKSAELWDLDDNLAAMEQLGSMPEAEHPSPSWWSPPPSDATSTVGRSFSSRSAGSFQAPLAATER